MKSRGKTPEGEEGGKESEREKGKQEEEEEEKGEKGGKEEETRQIGSSSKSLKGKTCFLILLYFRLYSRKKT